MSGHRKFSELTKHFTPEDRKIIEEKKAAMRAEMQQPGKPNKVSAAPPREQVRRSHAAGDR